MATRKPLIMKKIGIVARPRIATSTSNRLSGLVTWPTKTAMVATTRIRWMKLE